MRILVVDDSALMRRALSEILGVLPNSEVRTARNGKEALDLVNTFDPKVVTLDVNMPVMDGLTCLSHIMTESPRPVVMVSSITSEDSEPTLEALSMGAVDVVEKPGGTVSRRMDEIGDHIRRVVSGAVRAKPSARVRRRKEPTSRVTRGESRPPKSGASARASSTRAKSLGRTRQNNLILIGVSTGGPAALEEVLPHLPAELGAPVVVAQHMPKNFTGSFARRLDGKCALQVVEAVDVVPLEPNTIYIIHGGGDAVIERRLGTLVLAPKPFDPQHTWHPSVDVLVGSALKVHPPEQTLGVLLTGMGNDGAKAMAELHRRGGWTLAESESSAVVYGMPRELVALGGAAEVCDLSGIAERIRSWADEKVG